MNRSFICYQAWRLMFIRMKQMYTNSVLIQSTDKNSYVHSILNLFFIYALKYPMSVFEFRLERRRRRS